MAGGANVYGFAGGDPVNYADPFGLRECPAGWDRVAPSDSASKPVCQNRRDPTKVKDDDFHKKERQQRDLDRIRVEQLLDEAACEDATQATVVSLLTDASLAFLGSGQTAAGAATIYVGGSLAQGSIVPLVNSTRLMNRQRAVCSGRAPN